MAQNFARAAELQHLTYENRYSLAIEMAESGYAFIKELGSGLFGTCYLCINPFGKAVVLRYEPASYQLNQGKNHYEAGILSTLSHPSIPELLECLILVAVNI